MATAALKISSVSLDIMENEFFTALPGAGGGKKPEKKLRWGKLKVTRSSAIRTVSTGRL